MKDLRHSAFQVNMKSKATSTSGASCAVTTLTDLTAWSCPGVALCSHSQQQPCVVEASMCGPKCAHITTLHPFHQLRLTKTGRTRQLTPCGGVTDFSLYASALLGIFTRIHSWISHPREGFLKTHQCGLIQRDVRHPSPVT